MVPQPVLRKVGPFLGVTLAVAVAAAAAALSSALQWSTATVVTCSAVSAVVALVAQFAWSAVAQRRAVEAARERAYETAVLSWPQKAKVRRDSVVSLLSPHARVVRYVFYSTLTDFVTRWCEHSAKHIDILVMGGSAGAGKTRLLVQVAKRLTRLREPWRCGAVRVNSEREAIEAGLALTEPVLLVLDHWIPSPTLVALLERLLAEARVDQRIRVVITNRTGVDGRWWDTVLSAADGGSEELLALLDDGQYVAPEEWIVPTTKRQLLFDRSVADFARELTVKLPSRAVIPAMPANTQVADLAAAALASTLRAQQLNTGAEQKVDLEGQIWLSMLRHEESFWRRTDAEDKLGLTDTVRAQAVACVGVAGAADRDEAARLIALVPELKGAGTERHYQVADWLHRLYGVSDQGVGPWEIMPITPLALAANLVVKHVSDDGPLEAGMFENISLERLPRTLEMLACLATGFLPAPARAREWADRLFVQVIRQRPEPALDLAFDLDSPDLPMDRLIASSLESLVGDLRQEFLEGLPAPPPATRSLGRWTHTTVAIARHQVALSAGDVRWQGRRLSELAMALRLIGNYREAKTVAIQAVRVNREWYTTDVETARRWLAESLRVLAHARSMTRRDDTAETNAGEAVQLDQEWYATDPDAARGGLADSLRRLADVQRAAGRYEAAEASAGEAVQLDRQWYAAAPDAARERLGASLHFLSKAQRMSGRYAEAEASAAEAVQLHRFLYAIDPQSRGGFLAEALVCLSNAQLMINRYREAETSAVEAVQIDRIWYASDPVAARKWLIDAVRALAVARRMIKHAATETTATEAVALSRSWYAEDPDAAFETLADSLRDLAFTQHSVGHYAEAESSATEAVRFDRLWYVGDPGRARKWLAASLNALGDAQRALGREADAEASATEAAQLLREAESPPAETRTG